MASSSSPTISSGSKQDSSIDTEVRTFIHRIDSLARTLPLMLAVLHMTAGDAAKRVNDFLEPLSKLDPDEEEADQSPTFTIPLDQYATFKKLHKRFEILREGSRALPHSYLISLVSHFDAYLGRLIRALFYVKPQLLNASEKNISFQQLLTFESLDEAREFLIEKEVETILRESHATQFKLLEGKFSIPLNKNLPHWPFFIELTERRNLFVHTGGVVSNQYLKVCKDHGVDFSAEPFSGMPDVGEELTVPRKYFFHAYEVVFEMGFKLAHVLWRKSQPTDRAAADENLSDITYELIAEEKYRLAAELLDFATCVIKDFSSEEVRRRLIVNRAQVYKWSGQASEAEKILAGEDWTASSDPFQLAVAVLRDDFIKAAEIMIRTGKTNIMSKESYRDWPIFKRFRETDEFKKAYKVVFGEEFTREVTQSENDILKLDIPDVSVESV